MYAQVTLDTLTAVRATLPFQVVGLAPADMIDLGWMGMTNVGYWPIVPGAQPAVPETHRAGDEILTVNPITKQVYATNDVVPLTADEIATIKRQLVDDALRGINDKCAGLLNALKIGYPDGEVLSWDQQVAEAKLLAADASASAPLLKAVAEARGIPVQILAEKVLEKATMYAIASGAIIGQRQKLENLVNSGDPRLVDVTSGWPA